MSIPRIARVLHGQRSVVNRYPGPADPAATPIEVNDWVTLTSGRIVEVSGADPTNLLGIARSHNGGAAREEAIERTHILVEEFTDDTVLLMRGSRNPLITDVNVAYGLVASGGKWTVDATDTVATRVTVVDVDLTNNYWYVIVLPAHRYSAVGE